jgi:uncharacterized protein YhaN
MTEVIEETAAEATDTDLYAGLRENLGSQLFDLTEGRYKMVKMEEGLPAGLLRADDNVLPPDLLSAGTKDVLALALRLSLADYFLCDREGFLVMDDQIPLLISIQGYRRIQPAFFASMVRRPGVN